MEALHEEKTAARVEFGGGVEEEEEGDDDRVGGDGGEGSPAVSAPEASVEAEQPIAFATALDSVRGDVEPFNWLLAEIQ